MYIVGTAQELGPPGGPAHMQVPPPQSISKLPQVNRQSVQDLRQLREIAEANRILFLLVQRGDRALMLQIR